MGKKIKNYFTSLAAIFLLFGVWQFFGLHGAPRLSLAVSEKQQPLEVRNEEQDVKSAALPESPSKSAMLFVEKSEANLKKGEGWVHLVHQIKSDVATGVFLPDGREMPPNYTSECWCYIDKNGFLLRYIYTSRDESGNILQQSGYKDGVLINFTFGTREEGVPSFELSVDGGTVQMLAEAEAAGTVVEKKEIKLKDKNHIRFSYNENYKNPVEIGGMPALVSGFSTELIFSPETGNMVSYSKIALLADGRKILFDGQDLLSAEFLLAAPEEILKILENIK